MTSIFRQIDSKDPIYFSRDPKRAVMQVGVSCDEWVFLMGQCDVNLANEKVAA
jgi:hypothetical protein